MYGPFLGIGAAILLWPILDWVTSSVHLTATEVYVHVHQRPEVLPVASIQALVVRHGPRSPMHAGAVLVFQLKDGGRVLLPGTARDAEDLLKKIRETTGLDLSRIDRPIRERSA